MTAYIDRLAAGQPDTVKAVLDLAYSRSEFGDTAHDRVLAAFAPAHADVIRDIADELRWAEDLRADEPTQVLRRFFDEPVRLCDADQLADEIAAAKEANAVFLAQMIASLLAARRPTLVGL